MEKAIHLMYARDAGRANAELLGLFAKLSPEERSKPRGAYYGSLDGVLCHVLEGTLYFLKLLSGGEEAMHESFPSLKGVEAPKAPLSDAQRAELPGYFEAADQAVIALIEGIDDEGLSRPVPLDWYEDRKDVPFRFLYSQLVVHGIHHRGQISQMLDEMGVEHDFSGISVEYLPV
jgi:uncharacterized damage-inducible protein DinB